MRITTPIYTAWYLKTDKIDMHIQLVIIGYISFHIFEPLYTFSYIYVDTRVECIRVRRGSRTHELIHIYIYIYNFQTTAKSFQMSKIKSLAKNKYICVERSHS